MKQESDRAPTEHRVTVGNAVRLITVAVDLAAKYLEIRAGNTLKKPTMQFLTNTMGIPLMEATNFRNFEGELDGLATVLGATVTGAHSTIALDQELDELSKLWIMPLL